MLCNICEDIQESEIAVFDISDNNANVAFEMGLALGTGTIAIFIRNEKKKSVQFSNLAGMAELRFRKTKKGVRFTNCDFAKVIHDRIVTARMIKEEN